MSVVNFQGLRFPTEAVKHEVDAFLASYGQGAGLSPCSVLVITLISNALSTCAIISRLLSAVSSWLSAPLLQCIHPPSLSSDAESLSVAVLKCALLGRRLHLTLVAPLHDSISACSLHRLECMRLPLVLSRSLVGCSCGAAAACRSSQPAYVPSGPS